LSNFTRFKLLVGRIESVSNFTLPRMHLPLSSFATRLVMRVAKPRRR
jgi:hypothetical protein